MKPNTAAIIDALSKLGGYIAQLPDEEFNQMAQKAEIENQWFTSANVLAMLKSFGQWLNSATLSQLVNNYGLNVEVGRRVGIVAAGNVPAVSFHDIMATLLAGCTAVIKPSSRDKIVIKFLIDKLIAYQPNIAQLIEWEGDIKTAQALLITGGEASTRMFEHYFKHLPLLVRRNRTGAAVLTGSETPADFDALAHDMFMFFGLGCRNVSHLMVPGEHYDFKNLFEAVLRHYAHLADHNKYINNYSYHKAIYLIEQILHFDLGMALVTKSDSVFSPTSLIHFKVYEDPIEVGAFYTSNNNSLQVLAMAHPAQANKFGLEPFLVEKRLVSFGETQHPSVVQFADGADVFHFLLSLA